MHKILSKLTDLTSYKSR